MGRDDGEGPREDQAGEANEQPPADGAAATAQPAQPVKRVLSGYCAEGLRRETRGTTRAAAGHGPCHGAWYQGAYDRRETVRCSCLCHTGVEQPRDLDLEMRLAREIRELAHEPEHRHTDMLSSRPKSRADGKCRNDHEMTSENTGPGGVCRHCKRDASTKHKAKKAAERLATATI